MSKTLPPRHAAYHSIVLPYTCGDGRLSRSYLGAVPLLVAAPYATSDKARYVNKRAFFGRLGASTGRYGYD